MLIIITVAVLCLLGNLKASQDVSQRIFQHHADYNGQFPHKSFPPIYGLKNTCHQDGGKRQPDRIRYSKPYLCSSNS